MECTDRVLPSYSRLLYNESKLEIEEHYTDTHGSKPWPATSSTSTGDVALWRNTWRILAEEFLRGNVKQGDMLEVHAAGEQLAFKVTGAEATTYLGGPEAWPRAFLFLFYELPKPKLATTNSPFFLVGDGVAIGSSNRWPDARKTPLRQIGCERDQKSALSTRKITWRASSSFSALT